jgi:hypothetical protein
LKWKAERSKHRAIGKKQSDTLNWAVLANAISRTLYTRGSRSDLLASPRIWSVPGVSEIVGASYTENRKGCRSRPNFVDVGFPLAVFQGSAMIIDANELRGLADECVAAAAKCNDPDAAAKLLEIATRILELVRREMKPDIEQPFDGRRSAG